jgi:hypothetical protein
MTRRGVIYILLGRVLRDKGRRMDSGMYCRTEIQIYNIYEKHCLILYVREQGSASEYAVYIYAS